jgi:UPF0755 protein
MKKFFRRVFASLIVIAILFSIAAVYELQPMPSQQPVYIRYASRQSLSSALRDLQKRGIIRSARWTGLYARLRGNAKPVARGTYLFHAGMSTFEIMDALKAPIKQLVRLPANFWIARQAKVLHEHNVCDEQAYVRATMEPSIYQPIVSFRLPKDSLEGYLFPDTYDLPPMLGPEEVIARQLKNFEKKVWKPFHQPKNLRRAMIVASLVELETKRDAERPIVAGVIENRLKKGMPLQIDATILYARQKWGILTHKDIHSVDSPYNTYEHKGLPPGPICSPALKSIEAALHPAKHEYLYYVAMPDGHQEFSKTLQEQDHYIRARKLALAATKPQEHS